MAEIRRVLQIPPRTLSRRLSEKRKEYDGLVDDAQAAALFAAANGIRIERFTSAELRASLAPLRRSHGAQAPPIAIPPPRPKPPRQVTVKIDTDVGENVPYIDVGIERGARDMGHAYPYFYLFENSARGLVLSRMDEAYPAGWWDEAHVAREVIRDVSSRISNERAHRWHASRGGHPIFYTDLDDLRSIISRHWKAAFESPLGDLTRVQAMFTEMEELRNVVAHNNPLEAHDLERLQSNFRTWVRQLRPTSPSSPPTTVST
jgi:hypothetical protein